MEDAMNLRMTVLRLALRLEYLVTKIIKTYFSISKPKLKALSDKSGNLTFKNKIDLLNDFEIINDDEYKKLIILMEFRNQFMHNIACSSFVEAVALLGTDRGKLLLSFTKDEKQPTSLEEQYIVDTRYVPLSVWIF